MPKAQDSVRDDILREGCDDYVSASWVYGVAMETGLVSDADIRALAVGVIAELISTGMMIAGGFVESEYVPWDCPGSEAIGRIAYRWATVGNIDPIANEIVWLSNTPEGDAVARSL